MISISAAGVRSDIYRLIERVNVEGEPVLINGTKGKGAVLVGEDDWSSIQETLYLMSASGVAEAIVEGLAEDACECATVDDLDW